MYAPTNTELCDIVTIAVDNNSLQAQVDGQGIGYRPAQVLLGAGELEISVRKRAPEIHIAEIRESPR